MRSWCSLMNVYQPRQRKVVFVLFLCVSCDKAGCRQGGCTEAIAGSFMREKLLESLLPLDVFFLFSQKTSEHIVRKALINESTVLTTIFKV